MIENINPAFYVSPSPPLSPPLPVQSAMWRVFVCSFVRLFVLPGFPCYSRSVHVVCRLPFSSLHKFLKENVSLPLPLSGSAAFVLYVPEIETTAKKKPKRDGGRGSGALVAPIVDAHIFFYVDDRLPSPSSSSSKL